MKTFLTSLALAVIALAFATSAQAAGTRGETRGEHVGSNSEYHNRFGTKFEHGFFYKGREHRHWSSCYFDERFGCYLYHCPSTQAYYYWCERDVCFYPTDYCPDVTYCSVKDCVYTGCPVVHPKNPPVCSNSGGFKNTIHPIPGKPAPAPVPFGLVKDKFTVLQTPKELGHGPVVPPTKTNPVHNGTIATRK